MPETPSDLSELRRRIDQLDEEIVDLLNRRADVVVQIGKLKQQSNQAIYVPDRENRSSTTSAPSTRARCPTG